MNVFVLCTGRSGSTTFTKACGHITNYTSAHEGKWDKPSELLGEARLTFPDNHIEVDNRLVWFIGRLDKMYGDNAFYVHLKRDDVATAKSFIQPYRWRLGIIRAYRHPGVLVGLPHDTDPTAIALDYCTTVNTNIELFLKDKTHKMVFRLEAFAEDFPKFWKAIRAEGEIAAALEEFSFRHNATGATQNRKRRPKPFSFYWAKLKRAIEYFAQYVRDV